MRIIEKIKDKLFKRRMKKQRAKKCYCDLDVWNVDMFIERNLWNIFIDFKKTHSGFPPEIINEEFYNVLDRMIFLLGEINEDTCSIQADGSDIEQLKSQKETMTKAKDEFYDLLKNYHCSLWN